MKNEHDIFDEFLILRVKPIYRASVREAAYSVTQTKDRYSRAIKPRVSANWPVSGSLRFTRESDGQRFEIVNRKRGWVCRKVNGAA